VISCDPQYYSGCVLLYGVLSISDRTLESVNFKKIAPDEEQKEILLHPFESVANLAELLFEEIFSYSDSAGSDIGSTEEIVINWSDRIREWTRKKSESLGIDVGLYYFVMAWWVRILTEFDRLLHSIESESAQEKYFANINLYRDLATSAQKAIAVIASHKSIGAESMRAFSQAAERLVNQLADEWTKEAYQLSQSW
jgi:hypothetical protein